MKVGLDVGPLKPRPAGVGVYVRSLANALSATDGIDLALFGRRRDVDGLPDVRISRTRRARVPYSVWVEVLAQRALRGLDLDVVHFTDGLVPLVCRLPTVVTVMDLSLARHWRSHRRVRYPRIPLVLAAPRLATRIVVPTRATADEVMKLTGVTALKIDVVPLAPAPFDQEATSRRVADATLARYEVASRGFLLALGTIEPRKNHLRVVRAFERLVAEGAIDSGIKLLIAGAPGWRSASTLTAISNSPARSRIKVLGYIPDTDIPALLSGAAAVVYASTYEGFGLPIIEAMVYGAAVVTSNVSSMPEVAGDAAVLVDPYDIRSIANGIKTALQGTGLRELARSRAARFTWARTAAGTMDSYERALSG